MRLVAWLPLVAAAVVPAAEAQSRRPVQVRIQVVSEAEGIPLEHSVVAFPELGLERFVGASALVVVPIPPGPAHLVVKRLGFHPKDTTITVTSAPTQEVVIALARLSMQLRTVTVEDWPPCHTPGLPSPLDDPNGFDVVEQLQQNAQRYRLLERTYPFMYSYERVLARRAADGLEVTEQVDTLETSSTAGWSYKPGTLVHRVVHGRTIDYAMRIPSLRDLSDPSFVANHCFHLAGIEEKGGQRLVRLDIVAAASLKSPDVNVAAWLDTTDFRLRAASFHLTKIPPALKHLTRVTSEAFYLEVIPYVPVLFSNNAESRETGPVGEHRTLIERQLVLNVEWLGTVPDGKQQDPPARPAPRRRRP